jgi:hypothetical protein
MGWEVSMTRTNSESPAQFHVVVGQCITQWALVEEELFQICWIVMQCSLEHASIVYYRTPTLDARLKLVSELVESIFPKPKRSGEHPAKDLKQWRAIATDFENLLAIRSQIAHHPVWPIFEMSEDNRIDISGFEIYMSQHERYRGRRIKPPLHLTALQAHLRSVNRLVFRLLPLCDAIAMHAQAFASQCSRPRLREDPKTDDLATP